MTYSEIINAVSRDISIPVEIVDKTYKAYWKSIKSQIQSLPLKETLSEEEFSKLITNFNIPSLGKLSCTYDRMLGVKKRYKLIKQIREKKC
jgi:hypothetical protein